MHGYLAAPRGHRFGMLAALTVLVVLATAAFAGSAYASGSPAGPPAGPTTPPFTQCPAIGEDTSCQYLIRVTSATEPPLILEDASQLFYDGGDDVTVVVQNESNKPLSKVHIGVTNSGDGVFGFDGDGICSESIVPKPSGCPFEGTEGESGYAGPDTVLQAEAGSSDAGTVTFPTPLANDQYTYFTLEAPPQGTTLVAGEVNDTISTTLTAQSPEAESSFEAARLTLLNPGNVSDKATILGPNKATATGEVEYRLYSDPGCTKEVANAGKAKVKEGIAEASAEEGASLPSNATYYWQVRYTGNLGSETEKNSPALSVCGEESMTFGLASVTTSLSGGGQVGSALTVPPGTQVTDTATVSIPGGQTVFGFLEYKVFPNASCTPGTEVLNAGTVTTAGIGPSSEPVTLTTPGTYYFQASYIGEKVLVNGKSACGSELVTVTAPKPPPPPPPPSSAFALVGGPHFNNKNGVIDIVAQFPAAGTASSNGVVQHGSVFFGFEDPFAAAAKAKHCKRGFVKKRGKCVSDAPVLYGVTSMTIPAAGFYTIVIKPTSKALKGLKAGKVLPVLITTVFLNKAGGVAVAHVQTVTIKLKKPKPKKKH